MNQETTSKTTNQSETAIDAVAAQIEKRAYTAPAVIEFTPSVWAVSAF